VTEAREAGPRARWGIKDRSRHDQLSEAGIPGTASTRGRCSDGPGPLHPVLSVVLHCSESQLVLAATGMLTRDSIAALEAQIDHIGCAEPSAVILDLTDVVRIDATGLNVVLGLVHYVEALGRKVAIAGARGQVAAALADARLVRPSLGLASQRRAGSGSLHPNQG
jgi:anti-anti-sigma factor